VRTELAGWIRRLFRNRTTSQQLDAELQFHIEEQTSDYIAFGLSPEEARRRAMIELGGLDQVRQKCREVHWENRFEGISRDLRFAFRGLAKNRRFALIVVVTLALGIGSSTLIFSMLDCVLFHPFPYKGVDRLASFHILLPDQVTLPRFPAPAFLDFQQQSRDFEDMFGLAFLFVRHTDKDGTEQFPAAWATPNTFEALGVKPFLGRAITSSDGTANSPPVFVMSYHLWTTRFGSDPTILGTAFRLDGVFRTLVAIMPPRFRFWDCEIWMPLSFDRTTFIRGEGGTPMEFWAVGHLKPGVRLNTATADLSLIAKRMESTYPTYFRPGYKLVTSYFVDSKIGSFRPTLYALMAAVTILLLIACSNTANLLLERATAREREISIRAALGASRGNLIRQFLAESFLLAAASCILGCVFATFGLRIVMSLLPPNLIPSEVKIALSPTTLWFAAGTTILTTLLCGMAPAMRSARGGYQAGLANSGKGSRGEFRHGRMRSGLVVAEVALSIVLLTASGLMMRTLLAFQHVDIGFDPDRVLYLQLSLPEDRYAKLTQQREFFGAALERISAIPGILAATEATAFPPYSRGWTTVVIPGKAHSDPWGATFVMCSEGYFQTLDRRLLRGRLLSQDDVDSARQVTVINETLARDYFHGEDPLGKGIRFSDFEMYPEWPRNASFEIIGVVADTRNHGLQDPPRPEAYFPYTIIAIGPRGFLVKTALNPGPALVEIRRQLSAVDKGVIVTEAGSIENIMNQSYYMGSQFKVVTLGAFSVVALLLVVMGIFSVMAYNVSLQTHEIGIRMALGARQRDVLHLVLRQGLFLICIGILTGVLASLGLTRFLRSQVWGVSTSDPFTFFLVVGCTVLIGAMACLLPAYRASQVDASIALRYE
jgi:predicted permease